MLRGSVGLRRSPQPSFDSGVAIVVARLRDRPALVCKPRRRSFVGCAVLSTECRRVASGAGAALRARRGWTG